ncbi:NAD binding domain of 6-phosphogluconate dehydrogenase [Carpediemonas membranifera]|uniref:NAD binding domain of 6-phosphogluconate dehydrogenase n=1 Tax=Carpediemonas membranifera TaxID=201153 RepID=A0A8J6BAL3_9EUKA|nr:NAD binding domain of 6-phosphogluconate dehydrogenase [Carpediemonas membranifera]|eukprot:KAG9396734.1 NAD binding domain of 6-phosphogluconate dehydrogenase [Carpediemonas membranifera]
MGSNLARNAASRGHHVVVYNRTPSVTEKFMADHGADGDFVATKTLNELVEALPAPRVILVMVKAGNPVDAVLSGLKPLLTPGDVVVDGGNTYYPDTVRRFEDYQAAGLHFMGMGVSGGEEGALHGPSMMPGGSDKVWHLAYSRRPQPTQDTHAIIWTNPATTQKIVPGTPWMVQHPSGGCRIGVAMCRKMLDLVSSRIVRER